MEFSENEIIGNKKSLNWYNLLEKVRNQNKLGGESQWIFRALDKWRGNNIPIMSSFDDAWERPSAGTSHSKKDRGLYESWMLLDFKREANNYLTHLPKPEDSLEWLALARHYEMPSRLVDFTYSFYVAAYLALSTRGRRFNEKQKKEDEDGCILAINLTWMKEQVEHKLKNTWCQKYDICFKQASFHNTELFRKFAFKYTEDYVVPVNPLRRNPRLAKQQGLFLCPGNIKEDFDKNLRKTLEGEENVKRLIRLRTNLRSEAMRDLSKMNVSLATLYPDLSGWAKSRRDLVHEDIRDDRFRIVLKNALKNPYI